MSEVTLIEIALENCEVVTVPKECIKSFSLKEDDGWIESGEIVLQNLDNLILCTYQDTDISGLERLKLHNDVTQIILYHADDKSKELAIDWKDDIKNNNNNLNQTTKQVDDILYINFK